MFGKLLPVGSEAPDFHMLDQSGRTVTLSHYRGEKNVVLVFYPADFTPGCTAQLCGFRDAYEQLEAAGIEVLAVNPFNWETHHRFAEKYGFPFPVLFDPRGKYARLYKAAIIRGYLHKRVVYAVDQQGVIRFAQHGNPPVERMLEAFR